MDIRGLSYAKIQNNRMNISSATSLLALQKIADVEIFPDVHATALNFKVWRPVLK
jgi:hypothetical protein